MENVETDLLEQEAQKILDDARGAKGGDKDEKDSKVSEEIDTIEDYDQKSYQDIVKYDDTEVLEL